MKTKSTNQKRKVARVAAVAAGSAIRPRPSNQAQHIDEDCWYYEARGKITFIGWIGEGQPRRSVHVNIPWKMLMDSARRCRPEQVKPNAKGETRRPSAPHSP